MTINYKGWQKLFFFTLGIFIGTSFCMKWMEGDFWQGGEKFTIIGLELGYSRVKIMTILNNLDEPVLTILRYHCCFDFVFMAGVYPGIAALCMMAKEKAVSQWLKKLLLAFALLQVLAWGCDIIENYFLLTWLNHPVIGNEFIFFHIVSAVKWILAISGALLAIPVVARRRKRL